MRRKLWLVLGLAVLAMALAACVPDATQNSLDPQGPYARDINNLFVPVLVIAGVIFVVVEGLLLYIAFRYRRRKGREAAMPPQIHGNNRLEIGWTILPALILVGVAVPTVSTIWKLAATPPADSLHVNVLGHQWWWEFDYPDQKIITANEMHIPVGVPVYVQLCAVGRGYEQQPTPSSCQPGPPDGQPPAGIGDAVIHSFWVPELAGKQDAVPSQTGHLMLEADKPGTYSGQCAEFCGLSHAYMRFRVIAQTPEDFDAWVRAQQADGVTPAGGSLAATGMKEFMNGSCIGCHAIQGTDAAANGGPNLTHFASRDCFAGCIFDNTPENVAAWLRDPPKEKPGSWMPNYNLTDQQVQALVAYLETLE